MNRLVKLGPSLSLKTVTREEVRRSRYRQYTRSIDIVSQCAKLEKLSDNPIIWNQLTRTVTQSVSLLKGEDVATILKHMSRVQVRDEVMLAAICESLKTLPVLNLVRPSDIASILWSFQKLNFSPSVQVLNALGKEVRESLKKYKITNIHLCLLFRYFARLNSDNGLVIDYDSRFQHGQLASTLQDLVAERIGRMGPVEITLIAQHAKNIPLKSLVSSFARNENVKPALVQTFLSQLDKRFGKNEWKRFAYMLRNAPVDSTGWDRSPRQEEEEDEICQRQKIQLPLLCLDDSLVKQALKFACPQYIGTNPKIREVSVSQVEALEVDMDFIRSIEEAMRFDTATKKLEFFKQTINRKVLRQLEVDESIAEPHRQHLAMRKFKSWRNRRLFKFTLLSLADQNQNST